MSDCVCSGLLQGLQWQLMTCQIEAVVATKRTTMAGHIVSLVATAMTTMAGDHMSHCVCSGPLQGLQWQLTIC